MRVPTIIYYYLPQKGKTVLLFRTEVRTLLSAVFNKKKKKNEMWKFPNFFKLILLVITILYTLLSF